MPSDKISNPHAIESYIFSDWFSTYECSWGRQNKLILHGSKWFWLIRCTLRCTPAWHAIGTRNAGVSLLQAYHIRHHWQFSCTSRSLKIRHNDVVPFLVSSLAECHSKAKSDKAPYQTDWQASPRSNYWHEGHFRLAAAHLKICRPLRRTTD